MALLSRSSLPPELEDQFEFLHSQKEDVLAGRKKEFRRLAKLVREMTDTDGWKQVLQPFLKKLGDPYKLIGKTPEEFTKLEPMVSAYAKLLRMVERLSTFADDDEQGT